MLHKIQSFEKRLLIPCNRYYSRNPYKPRPRRNIDNSESSFSALFKDLTSGNGSVDENAKKGEPFSQEFMNIFGAPSRESTQDASTSTFNKWGFGQGKIDKDDKTIDGGTKAKEKELDVNLDDFSALESDVIDKNKPAPLGHFHIYPKQVKKWIVFTKTPKGHYDQNGRWVTDLFTDLLTRRPMISHISFFGDDPSKKYQYDPLQDVFLEEQRKLPRFLQGRFRFGVQYDEIQYKNPKLKRLFSFTNASLKEVRSEYKRQAILKWRTHENDHGSDAIQVDILTMRIRALIDHLKKNKQDKTSQRNLQLLVKRRRGWMRYLKKRNIALYFEVLREIKLKDLYDVYNFNIR